MKRPASILVLVSMWLSLCVGFAGCAAGDGAAPRLVASAGVARAAPEDPELDACRAEARAVEGAPDLGGAPAFERARIEILGRARGEPLVLVREPASIPEADLPPALRASRRAFEAGRPGARVVKLRARHRRDPAALRALLLREGYLYSSEPLDALAMVTALELPDLLGEPEAWLARGADVFRLRRETRRVRGRAAVEVSYVHADGALAGRRAELLFGDRVAATEQGVRAPLHRDLRALAEDVGFDRARVVRRTEGALLAELRFGERWVLAVLPSRGATLQLGCLVADRAARDAVRAFRQAGAPRRRALARVRAVVTDEVREALRFDRPEGEETAERDGQLRPPWLSAYLRGRDRFEFDGATYAVFDRDGRPWPPQVCVDFVLDTFERASGTWYAPRGEGLRRVRGALDFDDVGIPNRRGVLALGDFAEQRPDLFAVRRFRGAERIAFGERARFFRFLLDEADALRAGDVVAIHGLKRDGRVHQHALLIERSDPVTGFPHGLADQMKRPRRRTWEGIMAEAPKRSLLYRARPTDALLDKVAAGG